MQRIRTRLVGDKTGELDVSVSLCLGSGGGTKRKGIVKKHNGFAMTDSGEGAWTERPLAC